MQLVNEAKDVLDSPEKRRLYDLYGKEGVNRPPPFEMPPEVFKAIMAMKTFCGCVALIYALVICIIFFWAFSKNYSVYDSSAGNDTNFKCLVTKVDREGQ